MRSRNIVIKAIKYLLPIGLIIALLAGGMSPTYAAEPKNISIEQVVPAKGLGAASAAVPSLDMFVVGNTGVIKLNGAKASVANGQLVAIDSEGKVLATFPEGFTNPDGKKMRFRFDISDPENVTFRIVKATKNRIDDDEWCDKSYVFDQNLLIQDLKERISNEMPKGVIIGAIVGAMEGIVTGVSIPVTTLIGAAVGFGVTAIAIAMETHANWIRGKYDVRILSKC